MGQAQLRQPAQAMPAVVVAVVLPAHRIVLLLLHLIVAVPSLLVLLGLDGARAPVPVARRGGGRRVVGMVVGVVIRGVGCIVLFVQRRDVRGKAMQGTHSRRNPSTRTTGGRGGGTVGIVEVIAHRVVVVGVGRLRGGREAAAAATVGVGVVMAHRAWVDGGRVGRNRQ